MQELAAYRLTQGETPFLHVESAKPEAVELYRRWGFERSRRMWVSVLKRIE